MGILEGTKSGSELWFLDEGRVISRRRLWLIRAWLVVGSIGALTSAANSTDPSQSGPAYTFGVIIAITGLYWLVLKWASKLDIETDDPSKQETEPAEGSLSESESLETQTPDSRPVEDSNPETERDKDTTTVSNQGKGDSNRRILVATAWWLVLGVAAVAFMSVLTPGGTLDAPARPLLSLVVFGLVVAAYPAILWRIGSSA